MSITRFLVRLGKVILIGQSLLVGQPMAGQHFSAVSVSVGIAPLGVGMTYLSNSRYFAGVANSGSNSVTVLELTGQPTAMTLTLTATAQPVPAPYAVGACGPRFVVSSPADGSVSVIQIPDGTVVGKVGTGPQPRAVVCMSSGRALVSNTGDDTLVIVDLNTLSVVGKLNGVAGASGLHGMAVYTDERGASYAWVGGTSGNVITVVNLTTLAVVARIPFNRPTAVRCCGIDVASEQDGTIVSFDPVTFAQRATQASGAVGLSDYIVNQLGVFVAQPSANRVSGLTVPIPGASGLATEQGDCCIGKGWVLVVTSSTSNSVYLVQLAPSTPAQFSLANGASFASWGAAPGSLASAFASAGASSNFYASALPLPTSLGNLSLRIGGSLTLSGATWTYSSTGASLAPLLFVGATQINFQVPPGIGPGDSVPAQLTKTDGTTLLTTLRVAATAPGIFSVPQNGQGQGAVLNQDFSQNGSPQAIVGAKPAARGSVIQIFATGAGETTPALAAGEAAPASGNPLVLTKVQPTVTIGGKNAKVQFSGVAPGFVGLWQINAEVPADVTPSMAVLLVMTAAGHSSNTITIAVQ